MRRAQTPAVAVSVARRIVDSLGGRRVLRCVGDSRRFSIDPRRRR
jgi:hypothetical protein